MICLNITIILLRHTEIANKNKYGKVKEKPERRKPVADKGPAQQKHIFPVNNAGSGNKILKHNSTTG